MNKSTASRRCLFLDAVTIVCASGSLIYVLIDDYKGAYQSACIAFVIAQCRLVLGLDK